MTLSEFYKHYCKSELKVLSAFNGKVLCRNFNPNKHENIADREVHAVWAEVSVAPHFTFGNYAEPIICVYVDGRKEYEETVKKDGAE